MFKKIVLIVMLMTILTGCCTQTHVLKAPPDCGPKIKINQWDCVNS